VASDVTALISSGATLASAVGGPATQGAVSMVTQAMGAATAASALASGNFLGAALGMASAFGGPTLASALSMGGPILSAGTSVMNAIESGSVAGALMGGAGLAGLLPGGGPAAMALGMATKLADVTRTLLPPLPMFKRQGTCKTCNPKDDKCPRCGNPY
jgi:hypothetical protein